MGGGQNISINKGLEKVDSKPLMDNVEGFKTSAMAVTAEVVGQTRELEVEPKDTAATS